MNKKYFIYLIFISSCLLFVFSAQKVMAGECPNAAGNYTLTSSCYIPSGGYMVIVDGNLTFNSGVTITMEANSTLIIYPGKLIYLDASNVAIAMSASGVTIAKKTTSVANNYATGNNCNTVCSNLSKTCAGIGQDSNATDTYYWGASVCTGDGSCSYNVGDCSTVMSDQCTTFNASCCGIDVYWTRCLCVVP